MLCTLNQGLLLLVMQIFSLPAVRSCIFSAPEPLLFVDLCCQSTAQQVPCTAGLTRPAARPE